MNKSPKHKILVSACLLGHRVRYDGGHCQQKAAHLRLWQQQGRLVVICPEMAGGLPAPRPPAEIVAGDATAVLEGKAAVMTNDGQDVSQAFIAGAKAALDLARAEGVVVAILKEKSPSCGVELTYDGSFEHKLVRAQGITARLLQANGIAIFNEFQIGQAAAYLDHLLANPAP